jgi:signal transduction histidine kinase
MTSSSPRPPADAGSLDLSPAPMAVIDAAGRMAMLGRAWREAAPWGVREVGAAAPRDLLAWLEARLSGQAPGSSVALADGARWWAPAASLVPGGVSVVLVEITGLQQAAGELESARAAAEAASRAKSQFLANMSHELRTPLNAILGFAELVRDGLTADVGGHAARLADLVCAPEVVAALREIGVRAARGEEAPALAEALRREVRADLAERFRAVLEEGLLREYAEHGQEIHAAGAHLLDMINDVLDFAKIEAGGMTLVEETFAVSAIVEAAARLLRPKADGKRLTMTVETEPGLRLHADRKALRQIMLNLISNAVKFTRPGGEVRVFARVLPDGGCETGVSDTGVGIPPENQALVFRPFVQVSSARDAREGTGLGLPLVQRMAEMHGARVDLVSELMRGTTVRVVWPRERVRP